MLLRRTLPAVLAVVALAGCPSVDRDDGPDRIAVATFRSETGTIPTPNDLAMQGAPSQAGAARELLSSFVAAGGFPSDQEVAVSIPIEVRARTAEGNFGELCPGLPPEPPVRCGTPAAGVDLTTVNDDTVAFFRVDTEPPQRIARCGTGTPTEVCYDPAFANGSLSLRRNAPDGVRRWAPGSRYVVALRRGVRTSDGLEVAADTAMALVGRNVPMTPENQPPGGVPDSNGNGTNADEIARLDSLRGVYANQRAWTRVSDEATCENALGLSAAQQAAVQITACWLPAVPSTAPSAFTVVNAAFPSSELISIQTFSVAPVAGTYPVIDESSGTVPLPSDLLLDGTQPATSPRVRDLSSSASLAPLAAGLQTLDGFSTTATWLVPMSGPILSETVRSNAAGQGSVFVYDLTDPANPVLVLDVADALAGRGAPNYVTQPQPISRSATDPTQPCTSPTNAGCVSTTIGLAPAVPVPLTRGAPSVSVPNGDQLTLPPFKEATTYAVIVTNRVRAVPAGAGAEPQPLVRPTVGKILLFDSPLASSTTPDARSLLPGVSNAQAVTLERIRQALAPAIGKFTTDTGLAKADIVLAYTVRTQTVTTTSLRLAAAPYGTPQAFGVSAAAPAQVPPTMTAISELFNARIRSLNALVGRSASGDRATGAMDPNPANWQPAELDAIVALPQPGTVPACPGGTGQCAPLVVFEHGLGQWRGDVMAIANTLAARGFVVAAIDQPFHGDRAFCSANEQCASGGTCTPIEALRTAQDAPGECSTDFARDARGRPLASGNFFVSANLFRLRDGMRQSVLDTSALILALAPPAPATNDITAAMTARGFQMNPAAVYLVGQSQGAINGTVSTAVNPRISRAVLNVGGGTYVDVASTSTSLAPRLNEVLAQAGISPGTPQFLQFLQVAKWVLDPAEPVNYAKHLVADPLPNLITGAATPPDQVAKEVFGQWALCDPTIPNPTNQLLLGNIGLRNAAPTQWATLYTNGEGFSCSAGGNGVTHGFLLDGTALTGRAQTDAASFLADPLTASLAPLRTGP